MDVNKLFPIGSVVLLKNAEKLLMIIGICPVNNQKRYDYLGVLYPEGYVDDKMIFLFNHDQIAEVRYVGFMDSQYQIFRSELTAMIGQTEESPLK